MRFWTLEGQSIRRAEVGNDKLTLHLSNGKTLVVSAAGFLHVGYEEAA